MNWYFSSFFWKSLVPRGAILSPSQYQFIIITFDIFTFGVLFATKLGYLTSTMMAFKIAFLFSTDSSCLWFFQLLQGSTISSLLLFLFIGNIYVWSKKILVTYSSYLNHRDVVQYHLCCSTEIDTNSSTWGVLTFLMVRPYFTFITQVPD